MNLQHFRVIAAVYQEKFNLTRAATSLFTTQPAISKNISDLEAELGVLLFNRRGKKITSFTSYGEQFYFYNQKILAELNNIKNLAKDWQDVNQGRMSIATTHTQARYTLPKVLADFRQNYPKVQIVIHQGNPRQIAEFLLNGEADIAIATEGLHLAKFKTISLFTWQHCVVVPVEHQLQQKIKENKNKLTLNDLIEYPIITFDKAFAGRSKIDLAFANAQLQPDIVIEAVDADVIKTYIKNQMGIGILPAITYETESDSNLQAIAAGHLFGENTTWLAYLNNRYLRNYEEFFINLCSKRYLPK